MPLIYNVILFFHIGVGFLSLAFFWIPVIAKKGSNWHSRSGHWYAKTMYAVGISAAFLSLMLMTDPIGFKYSAVQLSPEEIVKVSTGQRDIGLFLMAISALTLVGVRHGLRRLARHQCNRQLADEHVVLYLRRAMLIHGNQ